MTPKHIKDVEKYREAIAPYNFVELAEQVVPAPKVEGDHSNYKGLTGTIRCTLTAETPLYIRAALPPELYTDLENKPWHEMTIEQQQAFAAFFHHGDGRPRIPGSSLRGMLRSLIEIGAFGKVDRVSRRSLVHRVLQTDNVGEHYRTRIMREAKIPGKKHYYIPNVRAGYMEKTSQGWQIRPAQEIDGTTFARVSTNDIQGTYFRNWNNSTSVKHIWIKTNTYDFRPVRDGFLHTKRAAIKEFCSQAELGFAPAMLVYSGGMNGKKSEAVVYAIDMAAIPITIDRDIELHYRDQLSKKVKSLLGSQGVLQNGHPIFYLIEDGKLTFFGHTAMMRLPYKYSPYELIPASIREPKRDDIAGMIFGFVASNNEDSKALAGRVFFPDAELVGTSQQKPSIHPFILSEPKPTTFQHYIVQTSSNQKQLLSYDDGLEETMIRGHKLYWHKPHTTIGDVQQKDKNAITKAKTQYTLIRPLDTDTQFIFDIRFESLSEIELGAMLWALSLGSGSTRLKLGMGKPLGMGSVRIDLDCVELSDRPQRYTQLFDGDVWATGATFADMTVQDSWVRDFQDYVLSVLQETENFDDLERIKQLRAMLEWDNAPKPENTRYMNIERPANEVIPAAGKNPVSEKVPRNEYTTRPVLPTPLQVLRGSDQTTTNAAPVTVAISQPTQQAQAAKQTSAQQPLSLIGRKIDNCKVLEIGEDGRAVIELPGYPGIFAIITQERLRGRQVTEDSQLNIEILEREPQAKKETYIAQRRWSKKELAQGKH